MEFRKVNANLNGKIRKYNHFYEKTHLKERIFIFIIILVVFYVLNNIDPFNILSSANKSFAVYGFGIVILALILMIYSKRKKKLKENNENMEKLDHHVRSKGKGIHIRNDYFQYDQIEKVYKALYQTSADKVLWGKNYGYLVFKLKENMKKINSDIVPLMINEKKADRLITDLRGKVKISTDRDF